MTATASENSNVFSLARFREETHGFTSGSAARRNGMLLSYPAYMAFVLYFQKPWRWLFGARLADQKDQSGALLYLAPPLQADHVRNCRVFANRYDMLASFDKNRRWAEVGTFEGKFAREILDRCQPSELHVIDISMALARDQGHISEGNGVQFHEGDSAGVLASFPDNHFDYIYVDARHDLFGVARDVDQAVKKLKQDGTLVFNDYILLSHVELSVFGIVPVVNSLCNDDGWEMTALAMHYKMYCDVALRRRGQ